MTVIFTDLDGTLLDHDTYSWHAAQPALDLLQHQRIPWIPVTSKTRAEVEFWRRQLGNAHPFIVENGGAAYLPAGYFPSTMPAQHNEYEIKEWGTPYAALVVALQRASHSSGCRVRGFHEMTAPEVADLCELSQEQAVLAKRREYDEPFVVLDPDRAGELASAIEGQGLQITRGGRFWHILGANDKSVAVRALIALFERQYGPVHSIGLGDGWNDASFLNAVSTPVLIRSPHVAELQRLVIHGTVTDRPGPAGWNESVLALLEDEAKGGSTANAL
ncbi:MAG: HAD-IIB family hydrolase [Bryobacteraceae bacterium]